MEGGTAVEGPRRTRRSWTARLGWIVLVVTLAATLCCSLYWREAVARQDRESFEATAANAQRVVATQLERQDELLESFAAMVAADPTLTNDEFARWETAARIDERFPGNQGLVFIQRVPRADLERFRLQQLADPVRGLQDTVWSSVITERAEPASYCLQRFGIWRTDEFQGFAVPASLDFCSPTINGVPTSLDRVLDRAVATGTPAAVPLSDVGAGRSAEVMAVYPNGIVPMTEEQRRATVLGWVTASFGTESLVQPVVEAIPGLRVEVSQTTAAGTEVIAEAGSLAGEGQVHSSTTTTADGTWTITVWKATDQQFTANWQAGGLFLVGLVIAALSFSLFQVLSRSRDRALAMVEDKTQELAFQALHDELTGLPNRAVIFDRLSQMLSRRRREDEAVAVLFIDVDNLKSVNDSLGHAAGDVYLRAVASRLTGVVREGDTVGRLSGDEFVVLLDSDSASGPELVAQRVLDVMAEPIVLEGRSMPVSCSIGISVGVHQTPETILHEADLAMYRAKISGKGTFARFEAAMGDAAHDRAVLEWDLHRALERDELFLVYQPTFDLEDRSTNGVEALLRWKHTERGIISPKRFIPIAEESGLIVPIGRWTLHAACARAAEWAEEGIGVPVAVNVSVRQLEREGFVADVRMALLTSGLPPDRLTLEITETALMRDPKRTSEALRDLKELGVRLAIDDFGTGYSSMAYLQQFPVDAIKIDGSFVSAIATNAESSALLRTLVQLGKALGLETLAEGIEDEEQLEELRRQGCDSGQGFVYARPLLPQHLTAFLREHVRLRSTN